MHLHCRTFNINFLVYEGVNVLNLSFKRSENLVLNNYENAVSTISTAKGRIQIRKQLRSLNNTSSAQLRGQPHFGQQPETTNEPETDLPESALQHQNVSDVALNG